MPSLDFFDGAGEDARAALALDGAIAARLERKEKNLAADYLAVGRGLVEMQVTRGYRLVGHPTFEGYLKARPAFGRTYYSYLIRLGRAGELERSLPPGIGGAQLVEYAKAEVVVALEHRRSKATLEGVGDALVGAVPPPFPRPLQGAAGPVSRRALRRHASLPDKP